MRLPRDLVMLPHLLLTVLSYYPASWPYAQSFLQDTIVKENPVQNVLEHQPVKQLPACQNKLTGPIETTLCDYETIESVNDDLYSQLHDLVQTPFFKYFKVDLYRDCPFWEEYGFCADKDCAVASVDETDIPEKWRVESLAKVNEPSRQLKDSLAGCYYKDSDFCFLESATEGEYVDLSLNPERYTGYSGASAKRIWSTIYEENCFGLSELSLKSEQTSLVPNPLSLGFQAVEEGTDGECLEKRVYYKIISGLHASISTHICHEYLDTETGEFRPNLECFISRIASHPERLQYIYFNTVLLLRAVSRIAPYLSAYDICTGNSEIDDLSKAQLKNIVDISQRVGKFDETSLFRGDDAKVLKEEFKAHFRNVSRIMDCVGCAKCRLWGKVQVTGVGTALKILFEMDEKTLDPVANPTLLQRSELVALINTLHRFTESLYAVEGFRKMWAAADNTTAIFEKVEEYERNPAPASPSPRTGKSFPSSRQPLYKQVLELCQRSTEACSRMIWNVVSSITSLFKLSGKDGIPHPDI